MSNELIVNILNYINEYINAKISIDELSINFYFNKDYIMRLFKKEINMTIIEYINKKRIYNSLKDLKETNNLILKIAIENGFVSQEYYTEIFIKYMEVNPNTFRKFLKGDLNIKEEDINKIRRNVTKLKFQLDKIEKYRNNIHRETEKKLSLFK